MKKMIFVVITLFSSWANAATICTNGDLQGKWSVAYIIQSPAGVGECTLTFDNNLKPSGSCHNPIEDIDMEVVDGKVTITKICVVSGMIYSTDGQTILLNTKANPKAKTLAGTLQLKAPKKKTLKATTAFTKTGELSCSVVE